MTMRVRHIVTRTVLAFALLAGVVALPAAAASASSAITGGGSSFAALEIDQWRADTAVNPFDLTVNYTAQGSSFGRQEFISGNLDFGASDIKFLDIEAPNLQKNRCQGRPLATCFVYVPVSAGGVSFMFNLTDSSGNRMRNLKLTRRAACKIFTGAITKWNDPELVANNPQLAAINRDIIPTIRADGAGESYVFSEFCIAVANDVWRAFIADRQAKDPTQVGVDFAAGQPISNWPQNWGRSVAQPYADGVANNVASPDTGRDTITYVAAGYAKVRSFPVASMQNAAGRFTQPDEDNVTIALGYARGRPDGTFQLNFTGADQRAYFPSTYSYILAQTTAFDRSKGETLGKFLCYAISQGQVIAPQLRYARLSKPLVDIAINAIARIPGAPEPGNCFLAGAPPPPPPPSVAGGFVPPSQTPTGPARGPQGNGNRNNGPAMTTPVGRQCPSPTIAPTATAQARTMTNCASAGQSTASAELTAAERQKQLDEKLENASHRGPTRHGSQVWLLVVGVGIAWAISSAVSRRGRLS